MRRGVWLLVAIIVLGLPVSADAAFPGQNGKIAFSSNRDGNAEIYSMNPDGSGIARLTNHPAPDRHPRWSPDGTMIAFSRGEAVYTMNADGTAQNEIAVTIAGQGASLANSGTVPTWSPDGTKIAFSDWGIDWVPAAGGARTQIIGSDCPPVYPIRSTCIGYEAPAWSPDGEWIEAEQVEYEHDRESIRWLWTNLVRVRADGSGTINGSTALGPIGPDWAPSGARIAYSDSNLSASFNLWTMNPDASGRTQLTAGSADEVDPAWSPDGARIAFSQGPFPLTIHVMDAGGGNDVTLTTGHDVDPDWQPIPVNSYPRPKGATPTRFSLVPGYAPCISANREHGPPLAFASCNPPVPSSPHLTVGTPDLNGAGVNLIAHLLARTLVGNPATPSDEADVALEVAATDVRCSPTSPPATCGAANQATTPVDYTGELEAVMFLQITDKDNTPHPGGPGAATVEEFDLRFAVPCAETVPGTSIGSSCSLSTTVDALMPGAVKEGRRAIWQLDRVHVRDGGPDGVTATAGNRVFLRPGVFSP